MSDDLSARLDGIQMQAEDHHLVPAADVLPLVTAMREVLKAHHDSGGRCAWCRETDGRRSRWPCGEYRAISRALLGEADALHCPECGSPEPRLHPAVSDGGEVTRICQHSFHHSGTGRGKESGDG